MPISVGLYLIGAAALVGTGCYWFFRETGDPSKPSADSIRIHVKPRTNPRHDELVEARARIERQLEILSAPAGGPSYQNAPPDLRAEIEELQAVLNGVNHELDGMKRQSG